MGRTTAPDGVAQRLAERLPRRLRVERLIFFGSRADGRGDEWSDYDFIVVSPDFEGIPFLDRGHHLLPLWEDGVSYDFLCYTPEEFAELSSRLTVIGKAAREGIRLI